MNVPTSELADEVLYFGNVSGRDQDKFKQKRLTATPGKKVKRKRNAKKSLKVFILVGI